SLALESVRAIHAGAYGRNSYRRLAVTQAALLVLLAATAGAGIVAADLFGAVANGLELDRRSAAPRGVDGRLLLLTDIARHLFVNRLRFGPGTFDEPLVEMLRLEDEVGDVGPHRLPHPL